MDSIVVADKLISDIKFMIDINRLNFDVYYDDHNDDHHYYHVDINKIANHIIGKLPYSRLHSIHNNGFKIIWKGLYINITNIQ